MNLGGKIQCVIFRLVKDVSMIVILLRIKFCFIVV